nr:inosine triphosphate pyrophosphatase-like [Dermatophagoides farinae]
MKTITFITGNKHKLNEIINIIGDNSMFQIVHRKIDLPEYQGDLEFIVEEKCKSAIRIVNGPVLVEDTSLNITALKGLPGPYIKWFMDAIGADGLPRIIKDWNDKTTTAICMMAFMEHIDGPVHIFRGMIDGKIVHPRGRLDFGWDPCFQPNGYQQTYGEMDYSLKNTISHRFICTTKLKEFLLNYSFN